MLWDAQLLAISPFLGLHSMYLQAWQVWTVRSMDWSAHLLNVVYTGINAFGGIASLSNVSITGSGGNGGSEYIKTPLTTKLQNPSNVSLTSTDVSLPVYYQGVMLGRAAINVRKLQSGHPLILMHIS